MSSPGECKARAAGRVTAAERVPVAALILPRNLGARLGVQACNTCCLTYPTDESCANEDASHVRRPIDSHMLYLHQANRISDDYSIAVNYTGAMSLP